MKTKLNLEENIMAQVKGFYQITNILNFLFGVPWGKLLGYTFNLFSWTVIQCYSQRNPTEKVGVEKHFAKTANGVEKFLTMWKSV